MDDFDAVAFAQHAFVVQAPRHDFVIDFNRDAAIGQTFGFEQGGNAGSGRGLARFAIELDGEHARIVAPRSAHGRPRI